MPARLGRLWVVGALALVGFLYYKPLTTYLQTRSAVAERRAEVHELRRDRARLESRLARATSLEALRREARRIGLVRPDEHLYIVKGIKAWRKAVVAR
jgi:cell division protein FtsB